MDLVKIVGLGDSTTAGTPAFLSPVESPPDGAGNIQSQYAYWMMKDHPEWKVLNKGVNGERTDQIMARFKRDVLGEEPDIVVILGGVNDIYQRLPFQFAARNLAKMYGMAMDAKIPPIACSVLPYNTMGSQEAKARDDLNDWIISESGRLGIPFADTAGAVSSPDNRDRLQGTPDGLHPDVEGYKMMSATISAIIIASRGLPR